MPARPLRRGSSSRKSRKTVRPLLDQRHGTSSVATDDLDATTTVVGGTDGVLSMAELAAQQTAAIAALPGPSQQDREAMYINVALARSTNLDPAISGTAAAENAPVDR
eukprot:SAG22_NODE_844_length_6872_cov_10.004577_1_plen_108_part_00